jgi:hypothetical protein
VLSFISSFCFGQVPDTAAEKPEGWLDDEPDMVPDAEVPNL